MAVSNSKFSKIATMAVLLLATSISACSENPPVVEGDTSIENLAPSKGDSPTLDFDPVVSGSPSAAISPERLLNAGSDEEVGNWLMIHKTYDSNRYSPINLINRDNVARMELAFSVPLGGLEPGAYGTGGFQTTPLVDDGFIYLTDPWGTPYKIDVASGIRGDLVWICNTGIDKDPSRGTIVANRGVAFHENKVITNLVDGRVLACDKETGDVLWERQIATKPGEGFSAAPLTIGDKVLVGQSFGDWATRGWIAALNPENGEEIWRTYLVPEPGEPGSETWQCEQTGNPDCWKTGGAAAWVTGSYDPETNLTFWGTGNPVPLWDPEYRPGDNLYTNSTVALDVDSGEMVWHFQYTPGGYMDYDEAGSNLLIDTEIDGEKRKLLARFGRNGFFYSLDRTDGSYIQSNQYLKKQTWTAGINPETGKPIEYDPSKGLQSYAMGAINRAGATATTCPNFKGGVSFFPTSYNPETGIAYAAAIEGCSDLIVAAIEPEDVVPGRTFTGGLAPHHGSQGGALIAVDVKNSSVVARRDMPYPMHSGVLLTKDLLWVGSTDGTVAAYDHETLEVKWSINVGTPFQAAPITYTYDGVQYIAITGGSIGRADFGHQNLKRLQKAHMLWVFKLGATGGDENVNTDAITTPTSRNAANTVPQYATGAVQVRDEVVDFSIGDVERGKEVYQKLGYCSACHGWAGDGGVGRHAREPKGSNLRASALDAQGLYVITKCGLPGTEMPYHDGTAYRDDRCYGLTLNDFEPGGEPRVGVTMHNRDIVNLVAYLTEKVVGAGDPTHEQCMDYYGISGSEPCDYLKD